MVHQGLGRSVLGDPLRKDQIRSVAGSARGSGVAPRLIVLWGAVHYTPWNLDPVIPSSHTVYRRLQAGSKHRSLCSSNSVSGAVARASVWTHVS